MKVKDLIKAINGLDPEAHVFVWDAGDRLALVDVDTSFLDDEYPFIDLNTDTDKGATA